MPRPVPIYTGTLLDAGRIRALLEAAGVQALLDNANMATVGPWIVGGGSFGGVRVLVRDDQLAKARHVLEESARGQDVEPLEHDPVDPHGEESRRLTAQLVRFVGAFEDGIGRAYRRWRTRGERRSLELVAVYEGSPAGATVVQALLQAAGIPAFGDNPFLDPFVHFPAQQTMRVRVREDMLDEARLVLELPSEPEAPAASGEPLP